MESSSSLQGWSIIPQFIYGMERKCNQVVDDYFMLNKRLITTSRCLASDTSNIQPNEEFIVGPRDYELSDIPENYLKVLYDSDKINKLLMVLYKIAAGNPNFTEYIQNQAKKLGIKHQIIGAGNLEANEYWNPAQPPKKCTMKSFVKMNHQLTQNQILFIELKDHFSLTTSDIIIRSSRGEILLEIHNCSLSQIEKRLETKLRNLPNTSTLCIFINNTKYQTINLDYFQALTDHKIDFFYTHKNFKINPDYLTFQKSTVYTIKDNPKIHIFMHNDQPIVGTIEAIRLSLSGRLDLLLQYFNNMVATEDLAMRAIPIREITDHQYKTRELKYTIFNLMKIEESRNSNPEINQILQQVIRYCLCAIAKGSNKRPHSDKDAPAHFPKEMKHCKQCRVCLKIAREQEKSKNQKKKSINSAQKVKPKVRKTKYQCESCTLQQGKPVPLCVLCFKQYHTNVCHYTDHHIDLSNGFTIKSRLRQQTTDCKDSVKIQEEEAPVASNRFSELADTLINSEKAIDRIEMTISQINLGVHKLLNWTYLDPRYLHTSLGFPIHMAPPQVHPTSDTSTSNDAIELKKQHE